MWIRVALDSESFHDGGEKSYSFVTGPSKKEFYFDEDAAMALESDGFLEEMWNKLDALFDWGDCDFFFPDKCIIFRDWLVDRLSRPTDEKIVLIYRVMLEYANDAIKYNTGIGFDF